MNRRAIGCGLLAAAVFVAIGLYGMSLAFPTLEGCPDRLQWRDRGWLPVGSPAQEPIFGAGDTPVLIGSTFIGLTTRRVWGPPGSVPLGSQPPGTVATGSDHGPPQRIILDCDNGTFQEFAGELSSPG